MLPSQILNHSEGGAELRKLLLQLEHVRWFESLGKRIESSDVRQIHSWEEWRGPDESRLVEISLRQQDLHDELFAAAAKDSLTVNGIWEHIQSEVFRNATDKIPYDAERDTSYGPTSAVWHAAWTASLIGLCHFLRRPVPRELDDQWNWFLNGHWPCGWVGEFPDGKLLVY